MRRVLLLAGAAVLLGAATAPASPGRSSAATHVAFPALDGVLLRGHLWAGGRTAVVFSHMFGTTQSVWYDLAGRLAARGHTVVTFDFRGVGTSSGRLVIAHVARDTLGAVRFVRQRKPAKVVLIGASMGGTSSLVAAGHTPVDGVVVIASGMVFQGLDARPHLGALRPPKLFIVGERDAPFNASAEAMHARTPEPKQLLTLPTGAHGTDMFRTKHKETIYRAIEAFLATVAAEK